MPKKPPAPPKAVAVTGAQATRATRLRGMVAAIAAGVRPGNAPPKTPREITDEAARKKSEGARSRGR